MSLCHQKHVAFSCCQKESSDCQSDKLTVIVQRPLREAGYRAELSFHHQPPPRPPCQSCWHHHNQQLQHPEQKLQSDVENNFLGQLLYISRVRATCSSTQFDPLQCFLQQIYGTYSSWEVTAVKPAELWQRTELTLVFLQHNSSTLTEATISSPPFLFWNQSFFHHRPCCRGFQFQYITPLWPFHCPSVARGNSFGTGITKRSF